MNKLKQTRGHLKGSITRAHLYILETQDDDIDNLETRLSRLEETWRDFCLNHQAFFDFCDEEGYVDPESDFTVTENKYLDAKSAFMKAIRKNTFSIPPPFPPRQLDNDDSCNISNEQSKQQTAPSSVTKYCAEIELPKLRIAPFSGDYREWPEFRDMFVGSIGCKENLSGAQKLRYLKSFLTDDAAKLLNDIEITDSNYLLAWEKLERRYNKPLYIINAHVESFLKMPTVAVADSGHLRRLADKSDEVIRGLKALQAENRDPWLIYVLLNKTDLETRRAWALYNDKSEKATVFDLISFLEKRCDALEACASKSSEIKTRYNKQNPRSGSSSNIKSLAVTNFVCPMCKEHHILPQCSKFLGMTIANRRSFVRDQKLCYNCLGNNHSSSRCRSKARCPHCRTKHHALVHLDASPPVSEISIANTEMPSTSQAASVSIVSNHIQNENRPSGILPTVVVEIADSFGNKHRCRVLLDTGSQASFVTESLVQRMHLSRRHARLPISGISSLEAGVTQGAVTLKLNSCFDSSKEMYVDAFILNQITSKTPRLPLEFDTSLLLKELRLADPGFNVPGPIDILLGSDTAWSILLDGRLTDDSGKLIAHNTIFGWVVTGQAPIKEIVSLPVGIVQDVDATLKSFWEVEELSNSSYSLDAGDFADAHFRKTFSRAPDNKYIVELPFRQNDVAFSNTLSGALSRLFAMERRFSRQENLRVEYCRFMKAYQELGHMERIPENEIEPTVGKIFYLPHHAVITDKIRVVFDGSHKDVNGYSLNEMLHTGPPLQRNLINVCLRFRVHKFVFCADIVKMFRQIWVDTKHRDFQRIVWRERPGDLIGHYRLCTVTYGTSPAPFLSMRVLRQLAVDYADRFPTASHSILHDFYVDDILTGSDSVSEILTLKTELVELLSYGGLQLSKWSSNCWPILQGLDCEPTVYLDLDSSRNCTKVLGLVWNPHRDIFSFRISLSEKSSLSPTKRTLLSEISKVFDPMGFLAPATILFKMLFQELWVHKTKVGWDDPLPTEIAAKWILYRKDFPLFERMEIFRRFTSNSKHFDLIGFSDASEKAYSAVVYARSIAENGAIKVQLVAAKTRVAPVKQLTIPRLELCGALLLSRLVKLIRSSLDIQPAQTFVFCDSQIVLAWLSSSPRRWNSFIANRTAEILDVLPRSDWNHIRTEENPADCASRGIEPCKLLTLQLWWNGPEWLSLDLDSWPTSAKGEELDEVPEERKRSLVFNVNLVCDQEGLFEKLEKRVSSWARIIRIVAVFVRCAKNCKLPPEEKTKGFLRSSELLYSKQKCLLWAQKEFSEEIKSLQKENHVSTHSKLSSLSPFLDDVGLLRVGGRISNAVDVPFSLKHPIILPKGHPFSKLILTEAHFKFLHAGVSELFSLVRQEFWILGSRNMIRKIIHQCIKCFRQRQATSSQLMGNLPSSRLSLSFAFERTGCDYAGPFTLRLAKGRNPKFVKGYFALFICMATKALHLEVVSDLSTDAFLAALRRFIARRGKCSVIYSDNGTNFQGAARTLCEWYRLVQSEEHNRLVSSELAGDNIKWKFIPPHSPHFGGLWEAGVKSVKQHLRRVIGNNILTFEEMSTLLSQIEALLNSRPLCSISDTDLNPLTPSHFIIGRPYTAIPEPSYEEVQLNRLGRWQLIQNMLQGFWRRWQCEYLTSLQQRPKWQRETTNLKIGDLVVIKEPGMPPARWALARVEELHPGKDNLVRVVSVRTKNGIFKRPVTKLPILPVS